MKQIGCDNKDIINLLYFADKLDNYLQLNGEKYLENIYANMMAKCLLKII